MSVLDNIWKNMKDQTKPEEVKKTGISLFWMILGFLTYLVVPSSLKAAFGWDTSRWTGISLGTGVGLLLGLTSGKKEIILGTLMGGAGHFTYNVLNEPFANVTGEPFFPFDRSVLETTNEYEEDSYYEDDSSGETLGNDVPTLVKDKKTGNWTFPNLEVDEPVKVGNEKYEFGPDEKELPPVPEPMNDRVTEPGEVQKSSLNDNVEKPGKIPEQPKMRVSDRTNDFIIPSFERKKQRGLLRKAS